MMLYHGTTDMFDCIVGFLTLSVGYSCCKLYTRSQSSLQRYEKYKSLAMVQG